ncbi:MAG: hypothetical protein E7I81_09525, partial [Streptococcus mitis]|nr:hypothetical protein [Streptococcus mitis]
MDSSVLRDSNKFFLSIVSFSKQFQNIFLIAFIIQLTVHQKRRDAKFRNFDIIELSKSKGMIGMNAITAHSSQLTAHSSQLTAHSSQLTAH